ncbi:MAG: hypothetical protein J6A91_08065 [Bacteroidales bacterium]|nr:hypothetical protein [Bacteroidales bacterium]
MKKILLTAAESSLRSSSYVSPEAKVSEMLSGGVLCASALELLKQQSFGHQDWDTTDDDLWS